jgi:hypothetical protein
VQPEAQRQRLRQQPRRLPHREVIASPGQPRPITIRAQHRATAILGALVSVAVVLAQVAPASAASAACLVTNVDTGQTFTALQPAVDAASPGHRLTVEGTCHGTTVIGKDLVINGLETETSGRPILDGDGLGSVVTILSVAVTIEDLAIEGGAARGHLGGGLTNALGSVNLRDVIVRRNAGSGGGIHTTGTLTLNGASSISENDHRGIVIRGGTVSMNHRSSVHDNRGTSGVRVRASGTIVMNDRSSIRDNAGTGLSVAKGSALTMNDSSSVTGNRDGGATVYASSVFTMNDSSTVSHNRAHVGVGGVNTWDSVLIMNDSSTIARNITDPTRSRWPGGLDSEGDRLIGVICGPKANANVFDNSPDDCRIAK